MSPLTCYQRFRRLLSTTHLFYALCGVLGLIIISPQTHAQNYERLEVTSLKRWPPRSVWSVHSQIRDKQKPASHVTGIAPAPYHQLWISTHAGLLRFDGVGLHEVKARSSASPYPSIDASSITALAPVPQSDDLYLALRGHGVWRFSPRSDQGTLWPLSDHTLDQTTVFDLLAVEEHLFAATSRGLKVLSQARLIKAQSTYTSVWREVNDQPIHDLTLHRDDRASMSTLFTCGHDGVAQAQLPKSLNVARGGDLASLIQKSLKRIDLGRVQPKGACRGMVVPPASPSMISERSSVASEDSSGELVQPQSEIGLFTLFEDQLLWVQQSQEGYQAHKVSTEPIRARWKQRPYIDPQGLLWVPTDEYLLQLGSWREVRSRALVNKSTLSQERLKIPGAHTFWRSTQAGQTSPLWVGSLGQGLVQAQPSLGQMLTTSQLSRESGAGPISATGRRLWWVESCRDLITSELRDAQTHDVVSGLSRGARVRLPSRGQGKCIDALSAPQGQDQSLLYVARRGEVIALESAQERGRLTLSIKSRWKPTCQRPDCRITALTTSPLPHGGSTDRARTTSLTESEPSATPSLSLPRVIAGTQDGRLIGLTPNQAPHELIDLNQHLTASISSIKVIRFEPRHRKLLVGHHTGILVIDTDELLAYSKRSRVNPSGSSRSSQASRLRVQQISHYETPSFPSGPIRDLLYDPTRQIWWVASYGGGIGWINIRAGAEINARSISSRQRLDRFVSGLTLALPSNPEFTQYTRDTPERALITLDNQGITRLKLAPHLSRDPTDPVRSRSATLAIGEANGWLSPNHAQVDTLLLAATTRGAVFLDLKQITETPPPPAPIITSASFASSADRCDRQSRSLTDEVNQSIHLQQRLALPVGTDKLCLHFSSPLGVHSQTLTAQYRLTLDQKVNSSPWVSVSKSNVLRLSHLQARDYTLELREVNRGGVQSETTTLKFVVPAPVLTRYSVFIWLSVLGVGLLILILIWLRARKLRRELDSKAHESWSAKAEMRHYWQVFEYAEHALLLYNEFGRCVEFNPRALEVFETNAEQMNAMTPSQLGLGQPHQLDLGEHDYHHMPMLCQRPSGVSFPARVSFHKHLSLHGSMGILVSVVDLSSLVRAQDERLRTQQELSQVRRLESLGRLAGWVTHEVNNIFGVIEGLLESAQEASFNASERAASRPNTDSLVATYRSLHNYVNRGRQRLQILIGLDYRKRTHTEESDSLDEHVHTRSELATLPLTPQWILVDDLFRFELELLSWILSDHQKLEWLGDLTPTPRVEQQPDMTTLHPEEPTIPVSRWIDKTTFDLLMVRLALCLSESASEQESFGILVKDVDTQLQISLQLSTTAVSHLYYQLQDLPREEQHITPTSALPSPLSPLWSTLFEDAQRLGCKSAVARDQLSIYFPLKSSSHNPGDVASLLDTSYDVDVLDHAVAPSVEHVPEPRKRARRSAKLDPSLPSPHVLLVDDNQDLLVLLSARLKRAGFIVHQFVDSREAADYLTETDDPLELLITDVLMPHLNGRQLADQSKQRFPELPVLFISGYTDDVLSPKGYFDLNDREQILRKPFTPRQLSKVAQEILRDRGVS